LATVPRAISVSVAKVRGLRGALDHDQVVQREFVEEAGCIPGSDTPLRLPGVGFPAGSSTLRNANANAAPPRRGEHSREALREIMLAEAEVDALVEAGVVRGG
jgi:crotonobetainyl-CoA:carnitine CoA-transferase CaiB-like acyl-CoA transferase